MTHDDDDDKAPDEREPDIGAGPGPDAEPDAEPDAGTGAPSGAEESESPPGRRPASEADVEAAQQSRYDEAEGRIAALCQRLERARRVDYSGLSREELLGLWIDAEELMSWVMAKRLEAMHELQRRRAG